MTPHDRDRSPASESLEEVFSEEEFAPLLWERIQPLLQLSNYLQLEAAKGLTKRAFSAVEEAAHDLETYLDDYNARTNVTFAPITEFVACARGFARIGHTIRHILGRYQQYRPQPFDDNDRAFMAEAAAALHFAQTSLLKLLDGVANEATTVCKRSSPQTAEPGRTLSDRQPKFRLPDNIDDAAVANDRQRVAELASLYLAHRVTLGRLFDGQKFSDVAAMRRFVLDVADEEQCRIFEAKIHNLQSRYDTYIKGTELESKDPELRSFRGHVSITLHLLESMTHLVHFYERHENEVRAERVKHRIAELVNKDEVLDRTLNFCLYYASYFIGLGAPLADNLVQRYTSQDRITLKLPDGVVLHARPVGLITRVVAHHATPVNITIGKTTVYAGSILKVLMVVGANPGVREIVFEGDRRPLADLELLFHHRLGEDGVGQLPPTLAYLAH